MKNHIFLLTLMVSSAVGCMGPNENSAPSARSGSNGLRFRDAAGSVGVSFQHVPTRTENKWLPEIMGSGVVVADFNRDGAPDLVLINSGAVGAATRPEAATDRLFLNDGKGNFTDKTLEWNLSGKGYGQGGAAGDFDGDGWTDLFLTSYEGDNRLLRNTGQGFIDVTTQSGFTSDGRWATSAGFFDMDNDGDLDLYVVRYVDFTTANQHKVYRNRMPIYSTPIYYNPISDQIWRNDGDGRFTDVSDRSGITSRKGNGLALAIGDIDRDGDQDVYVANDSDANQLWINDGFGRFADVAQLSGSAYGEAGAEEGSMGVDFSDVDANDRLDIAVTNFQGEPTSIYSQTDALLFRELSDSVGIRQSSLARLKFGIDFFDADNDGDEDLLVANGHIEDNVEQNSESVTFAQPNSLYERTGIGRFTDVSETAGDALRDMQVSRGLATADLNGDGLIDYVVVNNGGTAQLAFNETTPSGNFVSLWLEGERSNRNAIGARVVATIGDRVLERCVMGAQSYLSVSDFRVHFGLGPAERIDELTIFWPGGESQKITGIQGGKFYYIRQGREPQPFVPGAEPLHAPS